MMSYHSFAVLLLVIARGHEERIEPSSKDRQRYADTIAKARPPCANTTYFYGHVAKTGGVSYVKDLVDFFGFVSCSGRKKVELRLPDGAIAEQWPEAMRAGVCNFVNAENKFSEVVTQFPSARPPRLLFMVRDPIRHVVSQFNHCQANLKSKQKWNHSTANLSTWIKSVPNPSICHFDPRDMQTTRICKGHWDTCRAIVQERAFFVARLEQYDLGLCALYYKIFLSPMPFFCRGIEPILSFAHKIHGTQSNQAILDDTLIFQIRSLTPLDSALVIIAETRFRTELAQLRDSFARSS